MEPSSTGHPAEGTAETARSSQGGVLRRLIAGIDPLPLRRTLRGYSRERLTRDLRAGLNVALVAFPQGIAYAMIAGLPISFGLFGMIVACLIGPIFAGSRFIVLGPTNATAVLLLSAFLSTGMAEAMKIHLVPLLLVMVGLLQVAAGLLNIGSLVSYISRSVIVGYISAAAVLIIANQIPGILGFRTTGTVTLLRSIEATVQGLRETDPWSVLIAGGTGAAFLLLRRYLRRWPYVALALVAGILIGLAVEYTGHAVIKTPAVAITSWSMTVPELNFGLINQLASAALALAFLGILESSSISKSLAAQAGERLNTNQEVYAMGMANVGCGLFGGMVASGSPTRSVLNVSSGATSPLASVACGLVSLVLLTVLGGLIGLLPRAALAVVVVLVSSSLINWKQIRFVVRSTPADAAVFLVTAGSALLLPLDSAIFVGTATSIALFLHKAGEPELIEYAFNPAGQLAAVAAGEARPLPEISIVHVEGSLFFGAAELLQEQIRRVCEDPNLRIIILRLKHAQHLDASAILALEELVQFMRENDRGLIVSGARKDVVRICKRTGLLELIGRKNFFPEASQNPTLSTRNALRRAQDILGSKEATIRVFSEMRSKTEAGEGKSQA